MRLEQHLLPGQMRRSSALLFAAVGLFVCAAYILADMVLTDDLRGMELMAVGIVVTVAVVYILNNWRAGAFVFFGWIFFEDLARKYLGNNMLVYFAKDVLAAVVFLSFSVALRRKQVQIAKPPFLVPLLLMMWFCFMQIFNPASTSIFYGLMGFKMYFYYVPFFFIFWALIETEKDLRRFFPFFMSLTLVVAALGIAQSILGHTFLNPTVIQEDIRDLSMNYRVSPLTGAVVYRPTSVFVSTGRFTFMLVPAWMFAYGYGMYLMLRAKEGRLLTSVTLAALTVAVALCSSRGAVMWIIINFIVCTAAFLWGCPWGKGQIVRILRTVQRTAALAVAGLALAFFFYKDALMGRVALYWETMAPGSSANELADRTSSYPISNFLLAFNSSQWPYGYGIGTGSLGVQYVARILHARPMAISVESGFGTLVVELGIVGLILWIVMAFAIIAAAWRITRQMRNTIFFPIAFVIFWFATVSLLINLYGGFQTYEDFLLNSLLWASLGILFRLPTTLLAVNNERALKNALASETA